MGKQGQYTHFDAPNAIIPGLIDGNGDEFKWNSMVFNLNGLPLEDYVNTVFHTSKVTADTEDYENEYLLDDSDDYVIDRADVSL